jgi:hypothetical protein
MDAHAVGTGESFIGWFWTGSGCTSLYGSDCTGEDCFDGFATGQDCTVAFDACVSS